MEGRRAEIFDVVVETLDAARELRFLGSPSIRINGHDIEPGARARDDFAFACRTYFNGSDISGSPSLTLIRDAIRELASRKGE